MTTDEVTAPADLLSTGIPGLDEILMGGLAPGYLYLIEGDPGSGKTTLATQFLLAGVEAGESAVFVSLSENRRELRASAASHGWSLDGIDILEVFTSAERLDPEASYTMFHPAEVELGETMRAIREHLDQVRPARVVIDSVSELRLLADSALRYRRQLLSLREYFSSAGITVLFTDDRTGTDHDAHLHSLAHGVISLKLEAPEYGPLRRHLDVRKMRAKQFREGSHSLRIRPGGLEVFPRLVSAEHSNDVPLELVTTGSDQLDELLGGGLTRGTSTLLVGSTGTGKSSLAAQFVHAAAERGETAVLFLFDERIPTLLKRSDSLGLDLSSLVSSGAVIARTIDPAELDAGEFASLVREQVDENDARMVIIDSLNGYLNAMPSERFLSLHLHELFSYLAQRGVVTVTVLTQHGILDRDPSQLDASYLSDAVVLVRHFESDGQLRRALSVVKNRTGDHRRTVHELRLDDGIRVGERLCLDASALRDPMLPASTPPERET